MRSILPRTRFAVSALVSRIGRRTCNTVSVSIASIGKASRAAAWSRRLLRHCLRWTSLFQPSSIVPIYSSAKVPNVTGLSSPAGGTPSAGASTSLGSPPNAAASRISAAIFLAIASVRADAEPSPSSVRLPAVTYMKAQEGAPDGAMRRYNPPPSACRPGVLSAATSRTVSLFSARAIMLPLMRCPQCAYFYAHFQFGCQRTMMDQRER